MPKQCDLTNFKMKTTFKYDIKYWVPIILVALFSQILTPINDEPDYSVRTIEVESSTNLLLTPQKLVIELKNRFGKLDGCNSIGDRWSLWHELDGQSCIDNLEIVLFRAFVVVVFCYLAIVFNKIYYKFISNDGISRGRKYTDKKNALILSFCMPSMIYYLGLISPESTSLLFSLMGYIAIDSIIVFAVFLSIVLWVDFGNGIIFFLYYVIRYASLKVDFWLGFRRLILLQIFALMLVYVSIDNVIMLVDSSGFLTYKPELLASKIDRMAEDQIPLIYRPLITIITFLYMTPQGVKSVTGIIFFAIGIALLIYRAVAARFGCNRNKIDCAANAKAYVECCSGIFLILLCVMAMPDYAFAKYYIFLMPVFINISLLIFGFHKVSKFVFACCFFVYSSIILQYILD